MDNIKHDDINDIFYYISKKFILPKYKNLKSEDIKYKNRSELVTSVDINVEKELKKQLLKILPSSNLIGEEEYSSNTNIINAYNENDYCWTVDPIDGTKNYVNGKEKFAIMLALTNKEKILYSWIYKPLKNEMCLAIYQGGAFINGTQVFTKETPNIIDDVGSISIKYWDDYYKEKF